MDEGLDVDYDTQPRDDQDSALGDDHYTYDLSVSRARRREIANLKAGLQLRWPRQ